jgi:Autotransporter beta-domain
MFGKRVLSSKVAACVGVLICAAGAAPVEALAQCRNDYNFGVASVTPGPGGGITVKTLNPTTSPLISIINTVNTAFLTNTTSFVSSPSGPTSDQQSGGVWGRVVAGVTDTKSTTTDVPKGTLSSGVAMTGSQVCHQSANHTYGGFQVGADLGKLNINNSGSNWHFGVTAGYLTASAKDTTPGFDDGTGNLGNTYAPGDLTAHFQVPFLGLYTVFTHGNFFADTQVRFDLYQSTSASPGNNYFGVLNDAHGISLTGAAGYRFALGDTWFIEPSIGGVWSRVQVDPLITPLALGADVRGTLRVDDIESLLGRATLRVGASLPFGNYVWQPFATASVLHEFAGAATSKLTISDPSGVPFNGAVFTSSTSRVGTYGQFGVGTAIVAGNSGWLGYGRVDAKVGESVEGIGVNMGLRYQW